MDKENIKPEQLALLKENFEPSIVVFATRNNEKDVIWWDQDIERNLLRLSEGDCKDCFQIFKKGLENHEQVPIQNVKGFFLEIVNSQMKKAFQEELIARVVSLQKEIPSVDFSAIFANEEVLSELLKMNKNSLGRIFHVE